MIDIQEKDLAMLLEGTKNIDMSKVLPVNWETSLSKGSSIYGSFVLPVEYQSTDSSINPDPTDQLYKITFSYGSSISVPFNELDGYPKISVVVPDIYTVSFKSDRTSYSENKLDPDNRVFETVIWCIREVINSVTPNLITFTPANNKLAKAYYLMSASMDREGIGGAKMPYVFINKNEVKSRINGTPYYFMSSKAFLNAVKLKLRGAL